MLKRFLSLLAGVVVLGVGATWLGQNTVPANFTTAQKPVPIPGLLPFIKTVREPVILLTTWASWCSVCMAEMPKKLAYAQTHPQVALVAVNIDEVLNQKNAALKKLNPPNISNIYWLNDPSRTLAFGVLQGTGVPESYVLNAQRQLLIKQKGPVSLTYGAFAAALELAATP